MIEVGQIWEVVSDDFWSSDKENVLIAGEKIRRRITANFKRGEFIEIRYPFEWHFRIVSDVYFHAETTEILKHCRLYGTIHEVVRFANRCKLQQILDDKLYKTVWE